MHALHYDPRSTTLRQAYAALWHHVTSHGACWSKAAVRGRRWEKREVCNCYPSMQIRIVDCPTLSPRQIAQGLTWSYNLVLGAA